MTTDPQPLDTFNAAAQRMADIYDRAIREHAQDLADECRAGDIDDTEALDQRIHEDCDLSPWVIYTNRAQVVLMASDNASAGIDAIGADGFSWTGGPPWSQLAYFAVRADLYAAFDAIGFNPHDASEWRTDGGA